ncbi:uncharacterized protein CDAR_79581 [Caerostris darwini]|uniref:Gustatory receptor n=1 Tax=Caerostris darwini TaxID=1538125 RepID=A0AAV4TUS5_9ARAC|nr:uncharacterized protein CDAR_79581 [Caerostris darwini]
MKTFYKYIFVLFRCAGIFGFTCSKKDRNWIKTFKILLAVLNVAIALFQISAMVSLLKQNKANGNIPLTILNLTVIANRCILTVKLKELENIINRLSKFRSNRQKSTTRLILLTIVILFIQGFIVCYKLASVGYIYHAKDILFQLNIETPIIEEIIGYCFEISMFLFGTLPNTTFCVFYSSVCIHMRSIILSFEESLMQYKGFPNRFDHIFNSFSKIKDTVSYVDDELCFLVFICAIYSSCYMYLSISAFLHLQLFINTSVRLHVYIHFANVLTLFIVMTCSASSVAEASMRVRSISWKLPVSKGEPFFFQQNFLSFVKEGISLTVWKIVPISRNFIFGILGVILTYTMLFDTLTQKDSK